MFLAISLSCFRATLFTSLILLTLIPALAAPPPNVDFANLMPLASPVSEGEELGLPALALGDPSLDFQWFRHGSAMAGVMDESLVASDANQVEVGGSYLTARNHFGVVTSSTVLVSPLQSPSVISLRPTNGQVEVSVYEQVRVAFSMEMDPRSLNPTSFQLFQNGTNAVVGTVGYDIASRSAIFQPASPLGRRVSYLARLTGATLNIAGEPLGTNVTWSFVTSALEEPNIGPVILGGNDDSSTSRIELPFPVAIYNRIVTNIWINNNGNITFDGPLDEWTAFAFPGNQTIIAGFFADVDTRPTPSGKVHYLADTNRVVITWDGVGYYRLNTDKLNRFQIILTREGLIGFSYDDMQWTTGSSLSSEGVGGFGGKLARAGFDAGNGKDAVILFEGNTPASLLSIARQTFFYTSLGGSPRPNSLPVANAGSNQILEQSSAAGSQVTLDGSGSTDDGVFRALTYIWREGANTLGTGARVTPLLSWGEHLVTLFAFDGQLTGSNTIRIVVQDTTPPETLFASGPADGGVINLRNVNLVASGSDNGSLAQQMTYSFSVDGALSTQFGPASLNLTDLAEGRHTVRATARDLRGNIDPTPASRTFSVDATPPQITGVSSTPAANQAEISWTTDEPARGTVAYGLTDAFGLTNRYAGPPLNSHHLVLTGLTPETAYYFRVQAEDVAGNLASVDGRSFITSPAPDLVVTNLTLGGDGSFLSGDQVIIAWTDINLGRAPVTQSFNDRLIVSNTTTAQVLLDTIVLYDTALAANGSIGVGELRARQFTFRLPDGFPGIGKIEGRVVTDANNAVFEYSLAGNAETNNTATTARISSLRPYPDLTITNIITPLETYTERAFNVGWTVCNRGPAAVSGNWVDRVYLSTDDQVGNDRLLAEFPFSGGIAAGECLTRVQSLSISRNELTEGPYRLVVVTDANNDVFELTNEINNATVDRESIRLRFSPQPNLQVSFVRAPTNAFSSQQTVVEWGVTNAGNGSTGAAGWQDYVWLSADSLLDDGDTFLGQAQNAGYLNDGDSYRNSLTVTLPQGIDGNFFIIVKADAKNEVIEFANEGDNVNGGPTHVTLTPPPDLRVGRVVAPGSGFSGQPMSISWSVTNSGPGRTLETSWQDQIFLSRTNALDGSSVLLGTQLHSGALSSGEAYTVAGRTVTMPAGISGPFYLVVRADTFNNVFEHIFEGNNIGSEMTPTFVNLTPPPDLEVELVSLPADALASHALRVSYRVANNGSTITPNSSWSERCFLSTDTVLSPDVDLLLSSRTHIGALDPGKDYSGVFNATIPSGLTGSFYAIVQIDAGNEVFELVRSNNIGRSLATVVVDSHPADLIVTTLLAPRAAKAGNSLAVSWAVTNGGSGDTVISRWNDRLVLSADAIPKNGDDVVLLEHVHDGLLAPGAGYMVNNQFAVIPLSVAPGIYHLFLISDSTDAVYEGAAESNNTSLPFILTVTRETSDLRVTDVIIPEAVHGGQQLPIHWSVENEGMASTVANFWSDTVYLSADSVLDANDTILGTRQHSNELPPGGRYTNELNYAVPVEASGDFYVIVLTDSDGRVIEPGLGLNNIGVSKHPIRVTPAPLPDLVISNVSAPADSFAGQSIELSWTVSNIGSGSANGEWYDAVYFSLDQILDRTTDVYAGFADRLHPLAPGEGYRRTARFDVPAGLVGPIYVFVAVDSGSTVSEGGFEANNIGSSPAATLVRLQPPADLVVGTISVPTNALAGQSVTLAYTVRNLSANAASGSWVDSIYFSPDSLWDIDDTLFARVTHTGSVPPGGSYSETVTAPLPGVTTGNYHVIVRSDIRNQLLESSETNNLEASLDNVSIDVASLELGIPVRGILGQGQSLFYRVRINAGETLFVNLDSDASIGFNELYLRYGQLPSRGQFELGYSDPAKPDQSVLVPETQGGEYYILLYGNSVQGGVSSFRLKADRVGFGILDQTYGQGGNRGNLTLRINGAQFDRTVKAWLTNQSGFFRPASDYYRVDSSVLFATFDLTGASPGRYDVAITNNAGQKSLALAALEIVEGGGSNLRVRVDAPEATVRPRPGFPFVDRLPYRFALSWSNDGINDALAPVIQLNSSDEFGPSMAAILDGNGQRERVFYGASHNLGPPGIFAPGEYELESLVTRNSPVPAPRIVNIRYSADRLYKSLNERFDWESIRLQIKPPTLSEEQFQPVFDRIITQVGQSNADFLRMLSRNANVLVSEGGDNRDIHQLLGLELRRAKAALGNSIQGNLFAASFAVAIGGRTVTIVNTNTGEFFGTTSLRDGSFILEGLTPGNYFMRIESAKILGAPTSFSLESGEAKVGLTVTIGNGVSLSGRVQSALSGSPVTNATVYVTSGAELVTATQTLSGGEFSVRGLQTGPFTLVAEAPGYARAWIDVPPHEETKNVAPIRLTTEASIVGRLRTQDNQPVDHALVVAFRQGTEPLPFFFGALSQGAFRIASLPSGDYQIRVYLQGHTSPNLSLVKVTAGSVVEFPDIILERESQQLVRTALPFCPPNPTACLSLFGVPICAPNPLCELDPICSDVETPFTPFFLLTIAVRNGWDSARMFELFLSSSSGCPAGLQTFGDGTSIANGFKNAEPTKQNVEAAFKAAMEKIKDEWKDIKLPCDHSDIERSYDIESLGLPPRRLAVSGGDCPHDTLVTFCSNGSGDTDCDGWAYSDVLAGGVGFGGPCSFSDPDSRQILGQLILRIPAGSQIATVTSKLRVKIHDTVDFCPGDLGCWFALGATPTLLFLETTDHANDVPFDVETSINPQTSSFGVASSEEDCCKHNECCKGESCDDTEHRGSKDPNDIVGPRGFGPEHWIPATERLQYAIRFENDRAMATAPAQSVRITQRLDANLDVRTFRLTDFGFGDIIVHIPENRAFYQSRLDLTTNHGIFVDFTAGVDAASGEAFWQLDTVDPATGDTPSDPLLGFLPPNVNGTEGQGFVSYSVKVRTGLTSGVIIGAQARISFDINEPIDTPLIMNTLDAGNPDSSVDELPAIEVSTTFLLTWHGTDANGGSAIAAYDIFVSTDGGPYRLLLASTAETSTYVTGEPGRRYAFYSLALDNAGNRELAPNVADATTHVSENLAPQLQPIGNFVAPVGHLLRFTNSATDANQPAQSLRFSLAQAPVGAFIDPANGIMSWRPKPSQAGTTYPFTVVVADDGEPPMSATQPFTVSVPHYLEVVVGNTNVLAGQNGFIPISVFTTADVATLVLRLQIPSDGLTTPTSLNHGSQIAAASIQPLSATEWLLTMRGIQATPFEAAHPELAVGFTTGPALSSAFVPVSVRSLAPELVNGGQPTQLVRNGRIGVITLAPLVEMTLATNGVSQLLLYGITGEPYTVEVSPSLNPPSWSSWWQGRLLTMPESIVASQTNGQMRFFRSRTGSDQ